MGAFHLMVAHGTLAGRQAAGHAPSPALRGGLTWTFGEPRAQSERVFEARLGSVPRNLRLAHAAGNAVLGLRFDECWHGLGRREDDHAQGLLPIVHEQPPAASARTWVVGSTDAQPSLATGGRDGCMTMPTPPTSIFASG